MWVDTADLPTNDGHPFFERLSRVLEDCGFDAFVAELCATFYADRLGRPSLRPGRYFRMLFIGYFEGVSSERGIAWRVAYGLSRTSPTRTPHRWSSSRRPCSTLADLCDSNLMPTIRQEAHHALEPLAVDSVLGVRQCHILRSTF